MRAELSEDASAASEGHMHMHAGMGGSGTILGGKDDAGGHSDPKAACDAEQKESLYSPLCTTWTGRAGPSWFSLAPLPVALA